MEPRGEMRKETVQKIARLAATGRSASEQETMAAHLARILLYVEQLRAVDTPQVEPMTDPHDRPAPLRSDAPLDSLCPDEALLNAPDRAGGLFRVPLAIEPER